jgi:DNA polymerase-3 subunit epsilon
MAFSWSDVPESFVSVDFETGGLHPSSAIAVGAVLVLDGRRVDSLHSLLRPRPWPKRLLWTKKHHITLADLEDAPAPSEIWSKLVLWARKTGCIAAHNASFDLRVASALAKEHHLQPLGGKVLCSLALARRYLRLGSHSLPTVCSHLGIALSHHNPLSDADACASIILALKALREARVHHPP